MASIEKRGPHQFRAVIKRKGFKRLTKTFPTKTAAREWADKVESDMKLGTYVDRREAEQFSLAAALDRYADEEVPKLKHAKRQHDRAKALKARKLAELALASIRPSDIADFVREREKGGVGANTIRLDLALLSKVFQIAIASWGMDYLRNPVKLAEKPKLPAGRSRRLQPAPKKGEKSEYERLIENAGEKFKPVIDFALETAMRRAEICNLDWADVDIKGRTAFLATTKNEEPRTVPLSRKALEILQSFPRNFSSSVFGYNHPDLITQAMGRATRKAKLKDLRFHDLRHEATSRLFENTDLDVLEIQMITGHKSLQMLARYTHLRADRLADRLDGHARGRAT